MLTTKNFDYALLGNSYINYLISFGLLQREEKVLLINDERIKIGETFSQEVGELEILTLKQFGEYFDTSCLCEIDSFLNERKIFIKTAGKELFLSGMPSDRIKEFLRKFPSLFSDPQDLSDIFNDDFDQEVFDACERIVEDCFKFQTFPNFETTLLRKYLPKSLMDILDTFYQSYFVQTDYSNLLNEELRSLVFALQTLFHGKASDYLGELEFQHLFLTAFLPRYKINEKSLLEELDLSFKERGGFQKKTKIEDWQFYKDRLSYIQLHSFEGVIKPGLTFFCGEPHYDMPFKMVSENSFLESHCFPIIEAEHTTDKKQSDDFMMKEECLYYFIDENCFGVDTPFYLLDFQGKAPMAKVYFKNQGVCRNEGQIKHSLSEVLAKFCFKNFADENYFNLGDKSLETSQERIPLLPPITNFNKARPAFSKGLKTSPVQLFEYSSPEEIHSLKGVHYVGPGEGHSLGVFSLLLGVKNLAH